MTLKFQIILFFGVFIIHFWLENLFDFLIVCYCFETRKLFRVYVPVADEGVLE